MTQEIDQIIEEYNKDPWNYLAHLPKTSESVHIIIELWKTHQDDTLLQLLKDNDVYIDPELIITSTCKIEEKLYILNQMFLTNESGFGNIIRYYKDKYSTELITDAFDLNAHTTLLENLIVHFNKLMETRDWNTTYIVNIVPIIIDIAKNTSIIESSKLARLLPLYYSLINIEYILSDKHEIDHALNIKNALNVIATHLYEDRSDQVIAIAKVLNVTNDFNYWTMCINETTPEQETVFNELNKSIH